MTLYFLSSSLKILSLYYLLLSAFPNTEIFGAGGGEREKDNVKMTE